MLFLQTRPIGSCIWTDAWNKSNRSVKLSPSPRHAGRFLYFTANICSEPLRVSTVSSDFESQSKSSIANGRLRSRSRKQCCRHEKRLEWCACTLHGGGVRKPTLLPYFKCRDPQPQLRRDGAEVAPLNQTLNCFEQNAQWWILGWRSRCRLWCSRFTLLHLSAQVQTRKTHHSGRHTCKSSASVLLNLKFIFKVFHCSASPIDCSCWATRTMCAEVCVNTVRQEACAAFQLLHLNSRQMWFKGERSKTWPGALESAWGASGGCTTGAAQLFPAFFICALCWDLHREICCPSAGAFPLARHLISLPSKYALTFV